ncbi:hypothetical protein EON65_53240 [archaeon]|nr:MAG: hypothetical protein EON65_53240 [archaeon]
MISETTGIPLFLVSSCWFYARVQRGVRGQELNDYIARFQGSDSNLKRNESEFSLGLNQRESIGVGLCDLGEMCSSGQVAVLVSKQLLTSAVVAFAGYGLYKAVTTR